MAVNGKRTFPVGVLRVLLVIFIVILGILILRPVLGLLLGNFSGFILNPLVELIQSRTADSSGRILFAAGHCFVCDSGGSDSDLDERST